MFDGMFGKIAPGMCRLSMHGGIAIKTSSGYKVYDIRKNRLTNCDQFVFDPGEEFFFLLPTTKARPGDIILAGGKPKCVIQAEPDLLTVINYEDSLVESLLPEHHEFMGSTYFYGKIVSMFGGNAEKGKKRGQKILQYMMLSEMMKGSKAALPLLLMGKGMDKNLLDEMFDLEDEEEMENKED